jgi:hypothetical protein
MSTLGWILSKFDTSAALRFFDQGDGWGTATFESPLNWRQRFTE